MLAASVVAARVFNPGDIRQESLSLLVVIADEPLPPVTLVFLPLTGPFVSDEDVDGAAIDPFAILTSCSFGVVPDTFAADLACIFGPRDNLRDVIPVPACPLLSNSRCAEKKAKNRADVRFPRPSRDNSGRD